MTVTPNGLYPKELKNHLYIGKARRQGFSSLTYELMRVRLEELIAEQRGEMEYRSILPEPYA